MTHTRDQEISNRIQSSSLYNADLAPTNPGRRTWKTYNYAALWVSMSVNILTYMLAASLIQGGMNWKQAVATVFLGNTIVLIPMLLNSHPGARYGIPFPVLARASFGVLGANVAAVLRALGRVRVVRNSDMDRRRGHQHSDLDACPELEAVSSRYRDLLFSILDDQPRRHS